MYDAWLRSGDVSSAAYLYLLNSSGARSSGSTDYRYAVRPASSNVVNLKKPRIPRAFGSVARIYNAWLRSGGDTYASCAYALNSSGGYGYDSANCRYAVRPASSNAVNFKKAADTRAFGSVARIYNAWVRSGSYSNANYAYRLIPDGTGLYNGTAYLRYAVRPASSNAVNF